MRISVVMPVLDEAARIQRSLEALLGNHRFEEIVVVDGGSRDASVALATQMGVRVLSAAQGRGPQMNAGAAQARGEVLLFLHADVRLPPDAAAQIRLALRNPAVVGGAFRTWHIDDEGRAHALAAAALHLADLRSRYSRLPYGDQGLFVRRQAFEQLGGFPAQALMEDLDFSRRLRGAGELARVPRRVRVSGRRFLNRPLRSIAAVNLLPLLYRAGVPAQRLAALYAPER